MFSWWASSTEIWPIQDGTDFHFSQFLSEKLRVSEAIRARGHNLAAGNQKTKRKFQARTIIAHMLKKIGPYRVEERLGVGGMGEVYKAYDDRLERTVAIKRIRPDKEEAEDNRERFLREARATARLNHPSIVHVYDIFKDGESLCIVMEYVEGRTLDTLVLEGPLEPSRVLQLGLEIATGLAEAHSKGIIHRDLKVENIILTPEGNAKILDFGLAKPILSNELDDHLTGKGQLVGTSRAMSPEYVGGEAIDHRSDLFSFGVLLYETSTGHSPFKAQNTLATLKQVMVHQQTPASDVNEAVPQELSHLIDRLLAKDPEERPDSAQEVGDSLSLLLGQMSSGSITKPFPTASSVIRGAPSYSSVSATATAPILRSFWQRYRVALVLASLVVLALTAWYFVGLDSEEGIHDQKAPIVVGDFENKTGDETFDDSLELAFRVGLEQSRHAKILSPFQIRAALQRMAKPQDTPIDRTIGLEICEREGARALVIGSIVGVDVYSLTGTVIDPKTGSTLYITPVATAKSRRDLVPAIQTITRDIRANLGESLAAIEKTPPLSKVTTANIEALKAYTLGSARLSSADATVVSEGISLLEEAIRRDPEFAMAYAKLGGKKTTDDQAQAITYLEEAWKYRDRLTESEKLYVQGWLARFNSTQVEEIRIWTILSDLYSNDYHGHFNLGMARWLVQYDFRGAAEAFAQAFGAAAPEYYSVILTRRAHSEIGAGLLDKARTTLDEHQNLIGYPNLEVETIYFLTTRNYEKTFELIGETLENRSAEDSYLIQRGYGWLEQGYLDKALESTLLFQDRFLVSEYNHLPITGRIAELAYRAFANPDSPELTDRIATSRSLIEPWLEEPPSVFHRKLLAMLARIAARHGNVELAQEAIQPVRDYAMSSKHMVLMSYTFLVDAEIHRASGDLKEAKRSIELAIDQAQSIQAMETLAQIAEEMGDLPLSIEAYDWIYTNRSRVFEECIAYNCGSSNVPAWNLSSFHLGRLYEAQGQTVEAKRYFENFISQWQVTEQVPYVEEARQRLEALSQADSLSVVE